MTTNEFIESLAKMVDELEYSLRKINICEYTRYHDSDVLEKHYRAILKLMKNNKYLLNELSHNETLKLDAILSRINHVLINDNDELNKDIADAFLKIFSD